MFSFIFFRHFAACPANVVLCGTMINFEIKIKQIICSCLCMQLQTARQAVVVEEVDPWHHHQRLVTSRVLHWRRVPSVFHSKRCSLSGRRKRKLKRSHYLIIIITIMLIIIIIWAILPLVIITQTTTKSENSHHYMKTLLHLKSSPVFFEILYSVHFCLPSLRGRKMSSNPCNFMNYGGGDR